MTQSLIYRVLMSSDWREGFRLVWTETFKIAAADMGMTAPQVDIVMSNLPSWPERRAICLGMGRRCAEDYDLPELACAWSALAVDPAWPRGDVPAPNRRKMFLPANFALSDAIAQESSLLDDMDFARTVTGWRLMEAFGIGGEDPILEARELGKRLDADTNELIQWALKWRQEGESA